MISREKLLELYTAMMKCRMLAGRAGTLKAEPRWEATYAAVALDLKARDAVAAASGLPLIRAVRGAALARSLAALAKPRRAATTNPLVDACDSARALKAAKSTHIAVAFFADRQVKPAQARKALSLAARRGLPVIFVSLRIAGAAPAFAPPGTDTPEALAFGVPLITVDGADVAAVYRVASESFSRARQSRIPTLIDCVLDPAADPVAQVEAWLAARGLFTPQLRRRVRSAITREMNAATPRHG